MEKEEKQEMNKKKNMISDSDNDDSSDNEDDSNVSEALLNMIGNALKDAIDKNLAKHSKKNNNKKRKIVVDDDEDDDEEKEEEDNDEDEEDEEDDEDEESEEDDDDMPFIISAFDEDEGIKEEMLEKIENSSAPEDVKTILKQNIENSHDTTKMKEWVSNALKIPFNKYVSLPIDLSSSQVDIVSFFKNAKTTLDEVIYGMDNVKEELMNYIAQFISNKNSKPRVLALSGGKGVGKTSIIRKGMCKILNRPIKCISMGGINDSSTFYGFDYTYVGSKYGIISKSIIESGVMNPIIYMDELDKISETAAGQDIMNFLIHITDPEQTSTFEDKYFSGIPIDLSKVLFVFSFNDDSRINPILLDRLNVVKINNPTNKEKVVIAKNYLLKEICQNVGMSVEDIEFSDNAFTRIINDSNSDGMRDIKRSIETIVMKVNTLKLTDGQIKFSFDIKPREVEEEHKLVRVNGKKRLMKYETKKRKIFMIDEDKVKKFLSNRDDNVSYRMMFL